MLTPVGVAAITGSTPNAVRTFSGVITAVGRPGRQHGAVVQQDELVGEARRQGEVVDDADHDEVRRRGEVAQLAHQIDLVADVEKGQRLVEEEVAAGPRARGCQTCASTRAKLTRCFSPPLSVG